MRDIGLCAGSGEWNRPREGMSLWTRAFVRVRDR